VLARVVFPRIQTFDSSGAPRRTERLQAVAPTPVDLSALVVALAAYETDDVRVARSSEVFALERRLQEREQELARALTRIAALEAAIQAR
jgi:hypothetical protein